MKSPASGQQARSDITRACKSHACKSVSFCNHNVDCGSVCRFKRISSNHITSRRNVKPGKTRIVGRYAKLQGLFRSNQYIQKTTHRDKRRNTRNPTVIFHPLIQIYDGNMTSHTAHCAAGKLAHLHRLRLTYKQRQA